MRNEQFQNANAVFKGHLRDNKEKGLDESECKQPIEKFDVEKLYDEYFIPGLAAGNVHVLQHKVFCVITFIALATTSG